MDSIPFNDLEVADQIEATLRLLALYPDLSLGRVSVFLDRKLAHKQYLTYGWMVALISQTQSATRIGKYQQQTHPRLH